MRKWIGIGGCVLAGLALASCSQEPAPKTEPAKGETTLQFHVEDLSEQALEILNLRCTGCHESKRFDKRAFTETEWNAVIDKMQKKGAKLSGDEMDVLRHGRKVE